MKTLWERVKWIGQFTEAIVGLFGTFFIGFVPSVFCLLMGLAALGNEENNEETPWWILLPALPVVAGLAFWVAKMSGRAMRMSFPEMEQWDRKTNPDAAPEPPVDSTNLPMAVNLALNLPRIPWLIAPILSLWWLAHFGAGVGLGLTVDPWVEATYPGLSSVIHAVIEQALGLPFTIALNVYLMLAVGAFTRRLKVLLWVWKWRFLIDILVTALGFVVEIARG